MIKTKRYPVLDMLRGFCVINMVLYHAIWDLVYIYDFNFKFYTGNVGRIWQQSICWTFILLSGFCFNLGRNKLKRGLQVFGFGALISLVMYIVMPSNMIVYGILTFIGSAMLMMIPLEKLLQKVNIYLGLIISFLLFSSTKHITSGYLGFFSVNLINLPKVLYANYLTAYFGLAPESFFSTDYFPILPWLFLFVSGWFLGKIIIKHKILDKINIGSSKVLVFIGKKALWIYLIHQVVISALFYLIFDLLI